MRLVYLLFAVLIIISCNENSNKFVCKSELLNRMPNTIQLEESRCFNLNPDFEYPKHSYYYLKGKNKDLSSYIVGLGFYPYSDSLLTFTNLNLNEYSSGRLWDQAGIYNIQNDSSLWQKFKLSSKVNYAAYLHSSSPYVFSISPKGNWNGKITATIINDHCLIFIEELKSPLFKRN